MVVTQSNDGTGPELGENRVTSNDDLLISYLGISSQIDGLGHLGIGHRYYNGVHASEFVDPSGVTQFGTEAIPPIVTRGVLLDMAALRGVDTVPEGVAYNRAEIRAAAKRQGIKPGKGDVVLFTRDGTPSARPTRTSGGRCTPVSGSMAPGTWRSSAWLPSARTARPSR